MKIEIVINDKDKYSYIDCRYDKLIIKIIHKNIKYLMKMLLYYDESGDEYLVYIDEIEKKSIYFIKYKKFIFNTRVGIQYDHPKKHLAFVHYFPFCKKDLFIGISKRTPGYRLIVSNNESADKSLNKFSKKIHSNYEENFNYKFIYELLNNFADIMIGILFHNKRNKYYSLYELKNIVYLRSPILFYKIHRQMMFAKNILFII